MAQTFAPKKVQMIYGVPLTGFMDGTFIEVDRNSDSFTLMTGADGEGARAASADRSGTITVTVLQTSQANDILSAALIADEATNVVAGGCMLKDGSGRTLVSAVQAWVKKPAKVVFSKGIEGREWVIETDNLQMFVGGN